MSSAMERAFLGEGTGGRGTLGRGPTSSRLLSVGPPSHRASALPSLETASKCYQIENEMGLGGRPILAASQVAIPR